MSHETVLFVGAGRYQVPGIERAQALGYRTVAVDGADDAPGLRIADVSQVADIRDCEALLEIGRENRVDGVVSFASEVGVRPAAFIAEELRLPGIGVEVAARVTNKRLMREAFAAAGVRQPISRGVTDEEEAVRVAEEMGCPVVVKPTDSAGSRGVSFVAAPELVRPAYRDASRYSSTGEVVVEEYVDGKESSVEGFVVDGELRIVAFSDKDRTPPPHLVDRAVVFPSSFDRITRTQVEKMARECVAALGLRSGPIHLEYLNSKEGPVPVEIAARGPGFGVFSDIIPYVTGVDVTAAVIRQALGLAVDLEPTASRAAAIGFLESPSAGVLLSIANLEAARRMRGVVEIGTYVEPGDWVSTLSSGSDRIGYVVVKAKRRSEVVDTLGRAVRMIEVNVADA